MTTAAPTPLDRTAWLLAVLTLATLVTVPFADFLAANPEALQALPRIARYALVAIAITLSWGLALALAFRLVGIAAWRALPVAGVQGLMVFEYHDVGQALARVVTDPGSGLLLGAWLLAMVLLSAVPLLAIRQRRPLVVLLAIALLMLAMPASQVGFGWRARARNLAEGQAAVAERARFTPNVYWIVLDGYPRADVLADDFGYDNTPFLDALRAQGFVVQAEASSNYATSLNSVSDTLSMTYALTPDLTEDVATDTLPRYDIVRGGSPVVARFRRMGYRYVHFSSGYDNMTLCGDAADECVQGSRSLDEIDVALLSRTPYVDRALAAGPVTRAAEGLFVRGSVDDLHAKLSVIQEAAPPFFVYAHVLMPHPPIRFDADCGVNQDSLDLRAWTPDRRPEFVAQVRCTNRQALALLDDLVATDPAALVIVQADHGSAFLQPFDQPMDAWTPAQIRERFSILSAMRLPEACRDPGPPNTLSSVNTFRFVFACLTGAPPDLRPNRAFVAPDGTPGRSEVVEYPSPDSAREETPGAGIMTR